MPVPVAAKVGIIAITVAVTAAVAVYESPELQRMANDLRRRIAIALHAFGDRISPQDRENLLNRPEDAEGFLRSRGMLDSDGEPGVDADDETRRRQRDELIYWNSLREEKKGGPQHTDPEKVELRRRSSTRGSSFDDFMQPDNKAEKGTFVFQSGSEPQNTIGLTRRRGDGARGLNSPAYTNSFTDEHGIDDDIAFENSLIDPEKDEIMSDIYSATDAGKEPSSRTATLSPVLAPQAAASATTLVDVNVPDAPAEQPQYPERELGPDEYMTAGQEDRGEAYSSIQSWAEQSSTNPSFYSPLPVSPAASVSEPELVSDDGIMTPTDTASLAGSGEDIGDEARSMRSGSHGGAYYDVMSEDEGMMTPASWTEVGSVVSESDSGAAVHAQ